MENLPKNHLRHVLLYEFNKGVNASQAASNICETYGASAIAIRTAQKWFSAFKDGDFSVEDAPRTGRPVEFDEAALERLLSEDAQQTHLFLSMQNQLSGKNFKDEAELEEWIQEFFDSKPVNFYRDGINKLPGRWAEVIENGERVFTNLLVRCLSRFLSPDPIQYLKPSCPVNIRKIHDFALLQLNAIGKEHSEAFKAVLNACPAIHHRLELAAQFMTANKQAELQRRKSVTSAGGHKTSGIQPAQPTIKLAMDFSAFK